MAQLVRRRTGIEGHRFRSMEQELRGAGRAKIREEEGRRAQPRGGAGRRAAGRGTARTRRRGHGSRRGRRRHGRGVGALRCGGAGQQCGGGGRRGTGVCRNGCSQNPRRGTGRCLLRGGAVIHTSTGAHGRSGCRSFDSRAGEQPDDGLYRRGRRQFQHRFEGRRKLCDGFHHGCQHRLEDRLDLLKDGSYGFQDGLNDWLDEVADRRFGDLVDRLHGVVHTCGDWRHWVRRCCSRDRSDHGGQQVRGWCIDEDLMTSGRRFRQEVGRRGRGRERQPGKCGGTSKEHGAQGMPRRADSSHAYHPQQWFNR